MERAAVREALSLKTSISASFSESVLAKRCPADWATFSASFAAPQAANANRPRARASTFSKRCTEIPFDTAVKGGEVQIAVQRPTGRTETIAVRIPAGIDEGKKIRVRGQGDPGPGGGKPGDILLTIRVAPHPYFQRQGNHLAMRVPVTLGEAAGAREDRHPQPAQNRELECAPGTSSGTKLRVKGLGVTPKTGTAGDLLAEIQIILPKNLTPADREAIQQVDQHYTQNPRKDALVGECQSAAAIASR